MLDYKTSETLTGSEFRLDWTYSQHVAQVEWLEIDYDGKLTRES